LTFEGGGRVGRFGKKFPAAAQGRKKIMHGKLRGKKISCMDCAAKKIPANHRHFSMGWLVGWLVQIPACSVANLSAVFT